jgi:hypothetical protein
MLDFDHARLNGALRRQSDCARRVYICARRIELYIVDRDHTVRRDERRFQCINIIGKIAKIRHS